MKPEETIYFVVAMRPIKNNEDEADFIINDETGILVSDYSSPELFIQAINKLKDSPDLRLRLASRAQSRLKESYSKDNWKKEIENIYG